MNIEKNREYCLKLLKEYTKSESLLKHSYAVEICLRAYANKLGEDEDYWGCVGLLHDFDYELFPTENEHPFKGAAILKEKGFENEFIDSVLSHATYTNIARDTKLKKVLYACDELAGFLLAVAYVRPNKTIDEVEVSSVKKKMKDKGFSRAINREDILESAKMLNLTLDEHIEFCINALKGKKNCIGM